MMNNTLAKEITKIQQKYTLTEIDKNTFRIERINKIKLKESCYYIIKITNSSVINDTNSVLATNWNNNTCPKYSMFKCEVTKILGSMIKITGVAVDETTNNDINYMWSGWIPQDSIEIIQQL